MVILNVTLQERIFVFHHRRPNKILLAVKIDEILEREFRMRFTTFFNGVSEHHNFIGPAVLFLLIFQIIVISELNMPDLGAWD